jgi:glycosyltransferase involved in cell wall biosynthesis
MVSDSRVSRHAETLGRNGFKVTVVCPLSRRSTVHEERSGYQIVRVRSALVEWLTRITEQKTTNADRLEQTEYRFLARKKSVGWFIQAGIRVLMIVSTQVALMRAARRTLANVYCANDLDTLLITRLAAWFDRRLVYDSHELWPDMLIQVPPFVKTALMRIERFLIARVDAVMTVNEFIARVLTQRYSIKSPVQVIHNYPLRSTHVRSPDEKRRSGRVTALYHGILSPERGLENLVNAAQQLLPDIVLVFRGSGALEEALKALARGRTNIRFERPVGMREVVKAAESADVGIVPFLATNLSNYYISPNKLFEYIQAGLPIAASNLPFLTKVVLTNDIGVVFDARDPKSIADAINQITRKDVLARQRKNVREAASVFCWEQESEKLLRLYDAICTML